VGIHVALGNGNFQRLEMGDVVESAYRGISQIMALYRVSTGLARNGRRSIS